eukprot:CAMPEP_0206560856 /NCGR_PEP_ID=MMETSP0325_2-20121206/21266_1 /ASSEMBLY_ACC=CAM_ASM_000347 /TAXON_ID=2866 /ORGANISM="Crypthecodinium cohnii, Strain Seligo" /LENGTH=438 /DNA_ID=CAMNT_0054062683 /DNA_START=48 /DNA_END=1367 /DNA_ORIENTATION=+
MVMLETAAFTAAAGASWWWTTALSTAAAAIATNVVFFLTFGTFQEKKLPATPHFRLVFEVPPLTEVHCPLTRLAQEAFLDMVLSVGQQIGQLGNGVFTDAFAMPHASKLRNRLAKAVLVPCMLLALRPQPDLVVKIVSAAGIAGEEGQVLRTLEHPSVIKLLDTFDRGVYRHLVLPRLHGGTLEAAAAAWQQTGVGPACSILIDFGLAHRVDSAGWARLRQIGTWRYMAPEVFESWVSIKSDVWSLGILAWMTLFDKHPFTDDRDAFYEDICGGALDSEPFEHLNLSVRTEDLVRWMLSPDAETRPTSTELTDQRLEFRYKLGSKKPAKEPGPTCQIGFPSVDLAPTPGLYLMLRFSFFSTRNLPTRPYTTNSMAFDQPNIQKNEQQTDTDDVGDLEDGCERIVPPQRHQPHRPLKIRARTMFLSFKWENWQTIALIR